MIGGDPEKGRRGRGISIKSGGWRVEKRKGQTGREDTEERSKRDKETERERDKFTKEDNNQFYEIVRVAAEDYGNSWRLRYSQGYRLPVLRQPRLQSSEPLFSGVQELNIKLVIAELLACCICHFFSLFSTFILKDPGEAEASPEFEVIGSGGVSQRVLRTGSWSLETVPCPLAQKQLVLQGLKVRFSWRQGLRSRAAGE